MQHAIAESSPAGMAIHELVLEAHQDVRKERRADTRYPFFRRVTLRVPGDQPCTAFSREISASGIGLLHDVQLSPGNVEVSIPNKQGRLVRVRTRIIWCQPCGEGWYISGGQFVGAATMAH